MTKINLTDYQPTDAEPGALTWAETIAQAQAAGYLLGRYSDPEFFGAENIAADEAEEAAEVDPSLIYLYRPDPEPEPVVTICTFAEWTLGAGRIARNADPEAMEVDAWTGTPAELRALAEARIAVIGSPSNGGELHRWKAAQAVLAELEGVA